jgi:hypothetical protein
METSSHETKQTRFFTEEPGSSQLVSGDGGPEQVPESHFRVPQGHILHKQRHTYIYFFKF